MKVSTVSGRVKNKITKLAQFSAYQAGVKAIRWLARQYFAVQGWREVSGCPLGLGGSPPWTPKSRERSLAKEVVPLIRKARLMSGLAMRRASLAEKAARQVTAVDERRKVSPKPLNSLALSK